MNASTVQVTAPTRVDIAGGTLDLWPIHQLLERPVTINFGISLSATVKVKLSPEKECFILKSIDQKSEKKATYSEIVNDTSHGIFHVTLKKIWQKNWPTLSIETHALSPAGAGLGGSSCLMTLVTKALDEWRKKLGEKSLPLATIHDHVRLCQDIEAELIHAPTGCQDYYGAISGGLNAIHFPPGQIEIVKTNVPYMLNDALILCYSGVSRASALNNWEIFKRIFDGDKVLVGKFQEMSNLAHACHERLLTNRESDFLEALDASRAEWNLRKSLWPSIETEKTKAIDAAAISAGAYFSRVCGAGGGGVMAMFVPPAKRKAVEKACEDAGGQILIGRAQDDGLRVDWNEKLN